MRKSYTPVIAILLLAPLLVAAAAGPATATDLYTIPLNKQLPISGSMDVSLIQVVISDVTYGGSYAPDPSAVLYPVLEYTYVNHGSAPETGHLQVRFVDDQGQSYEARDPGMLNPVPAGKSSELRTIEINIPKDRKLTRLVVTEGFDEYPYDLVYPGSPTPTPTAAPTGSPSGTPAGKPCLGVLLPLTFVGIAAAGRGIRKSKR